MKCANCGMDQGANQNPPENGASRTLDNPWLLPLVIVVLLGLFAFAVLPTAIVWALGGFQSREMFGSTSPDGRYRITIAKRAEFPANEFLDPSIVVHVTLSDVPSGKTLDYIGVGLWEDSDFGEPKADWTDGVVIVRDIDDQHHLAVTMNVRAGAAVSAR